ncbi:hypothetical protein [Mesorhizobium sp. B1-1-8]|uniref:hypothetical protein n=1 Tax=Mesorhizobium sp. B1-1-8 TaxID=2589976 RepID=UPI001128DF47|nr:hypothetical protein [Mesorhizobium sp. B1-1-8]UCI05647.1 hypothetical protein FJ974_17580 [Mesorhizobium sp. B1-1-8]
MVRLMTYISVALAFLVPELVNDNTAELMRGKFLPETQAAALSVRTLPRGCKSLHINGAHYYHCGSVYFRRVPSHYVQVTAPHVHRHGH